MMRSSWLTWLFLTSFALLTHAGLSHRCSNITGPGAAKYVVGPLPDVNYTLPMSWAGQLAIPGTTNDELFFWLFEAESQKQSENLIIWLNGGPGCSSLEGLTTENGPLAFYGESYTPASNQYSWTKLANVLYIDQPVGAGFSSGSSQAMDNTQVTQEFYAWLKAFYDVFPGLKSKNTYLMGESYAGVYIPYFSQAILQNRHSLNINLKSITIGDGIIGNPAAQSDVVVGTYMHQLNHTLGIPNDILSTFAEADQTCGFTKVLKEIRYPPSGKIVIPGDPEGSNYAFAKRQEPPASCFNQPTNANQVNESIYAQCNSGCATFTTAANYLMTRDFCFSIYNIAYNCTTTPNVATISEYLNRADVRSAVHAPAKTLDPCNNTIFSTLTAESVEPPAYSVLPYILSQNISVHLYSSDLDFLLNHIGTELVIQNMTWNAKQGFQSTPDHIFFVDGIPTGVWGLERGLSYHRIFNSGHQFPHDQPAAAFAYVRDYVIGTSGYAVSFGNTTRSAKLKALATPLEGS